MNTTNPRQSIHSKRSTNTTNANNTTPPHSHGCVHHHNYLATFFTLTARLARLALFPLFGLLILGTFASSLHNSYYSVVDSFIPLPPPSFPSPSSASSSSSSTSRESYWLGLATRLLPHHHLLSSLLPRKMGAASNMNTTKSPKTTTEGTTCADGTTISSVSSSSRSIPLQERSSSTITTNERSVVGRLSSSLSLSYTIPSYFSLDVSTEENYGTEKMDFYGPFKGIRASLDYSYHGKCYYCYYYCCIRWNACWDFNDLDHDVLIFFLTWLVIRCCSSATFLGNYTKSRQEFQDSIVEKLLDGTIIHDSSGRVCRTPTEPFIVFTAGVMVRLAFLSSPFITISQWLDLHILILSHNCTHVIVICSCKTQGAGKSHTIKRLVSKGLFPLQSFVSVDPDEIRQHFPEFHLYATLSAERAGELTHKEAGYVTEIATAAALQRGHNVLVDGSLRDADWYRGYFESLRKMYEHLKIAILHVTAPREAVFERARVSL